jgi:protoporphyrinogen oxidase
MTAKKIVVIGAGPAGLACAYKLAKLGYEIDVFEASDDLGGLARSLSLWNQTVDIGPHRFFSSIPLVNNLWLEVVKDDFTWINRLTRIFYRNRFFSYPLEPKNVLAGLSWTELLRCMASYTATKLHPIKDPRNFEEFMVNRFGRRLYDIFFRPYSEKLWGLPGNLVDKSWASQRIRSFSLGEAFRSAFQLTKTKHRTLVDQFMYPRGGTGQVYKKMASEIERLGGRIHFNSPALRVNVNAQKEVTSVEFAKGVKCTADWVVSTMPIGNLIERISSTPAVVKDLASQLRFRNTILVYLECDSTQLFKDNWIYLQSPEIRQGRVTNFRNWCPSLYKESKTTILCSESWCFPEDKVWSDSDESLSYLAENELRKTGLIPKEIKVLNRKVIRIPKSYPLYEVGFQQPLKEIQLFLNGIAGLLSIGRYGSFKYNNQDHSLLMGILAAAEIHSGKHLNIWDVNSDEDYQEGKKISDLLNERKDTSISYEAA